MVTTRWRLIRKLYEQGDEVTGPHFRVGDEERPYRGKAEGATGGVDIRFEGGEVSRTDHGGDTIVAFAPENSLPSCPDCQEGRLFNAGTDDIEWPVVGCPECSSVYEVLPAPERSKTKRPTRPKTQSTQDTPPLEPKSRPGRAQKKAKHNRTAAERMRELGRRQAGRSAPNKGKTYPPEPLTTDEVRAMLATCSRRAPSSIRNAALLVTLWRAGLRIAEALALEPKDVDREACSLRVLHGKGDESRTVGMDPEAFALLDRWLDVRARRGINGRAPVFCALKGAPLKSQYVRVMLNRLARRADIEKRVHPHGLRHTLATELRAEGIDIGVISKQLGHSSIATTARYLDHVAPQAVLDAMRSRTWVDDD